MRHDASFVRRPCVTACERPLSSNAARYVTGQLLYICGYIASI
ncbi:MAG: hypothetical protein ACREGK_01470 [Geminicoccales bacterium]